MIYYIVPYIILIVIGTIAVFKEDKPKAHKNLLCLWVFWAVGMLITGSYGNLVSFLAFMIGSVPTLFKKKTV